MKLLIFITTGILFSTAIRAQEQFSAPGNMPADSQRMYTEIQAKRLSNLLFLQQTLNYSRISLASPPYSEYGSPKKFYILSADISPHFVIGGKKWRVPIHITPRYKVRIFRERPEIGDSSLPVRTPSYMPGATAYWLFGRMNDSTPKIHFLSLSVFHHSNGQDGNEFKTPDSLNLYNGNFSTNYVELAYHFRKRTYDTTTDALCGSAQQNYRDKHLRVGAEIHFNTATALKSTYGDQRLNIQYDIIRVVNYCDFILNRQAEAPYYREKDRWLFSATVIGGKRELGLSKLEKRINIDATYTRRFRGSPNTSAFIGAGYYGSDTYNIYYQQSYFYARLGIALGFFVAPGMTGNR